MLYVVSKGETVFSCMMILLQMSRLIDIYIYFSLAPSFLLQKESGISCEGISLTAQTPAVLFGYPVWFQGQGLWSFILIHSGHWCGERSQAEHQHVPPRAHLRSAPSRRPAMPGALPCSLLSSWQEKTGDWGLGMRGAAPLHFLCPVLYPPNGWRTCHCCCDHYSHILVPGQIGSSMPDLTASWNTDILLNALEITAAQSSE